MTINRVGMAAALFSLAAATIHGIAMPEHFEEWVGYGLFFLFASLGQGIYGIMLLGRYGQTSGVRKPALADRPYFNTIGIVLNVAIVVLYAVTRTVGIPFFGPEAGEVESVTPLSAASKVAEVALIACLLWLSRSRRVTA